MAMIDPARQTDRIVQHALKGQTDLTAPSAPAVQLIPDFRARPDPARRSTDRQAASEGAAKPVAPVL